MKSCNNKKQSIGQDQSTCFKCKLIACVGDRDDNRRGVSTFRLNQPRNDRSSQPKVESVGAKPVGQGMPGIQIIKSRIGLIRSSRSIDGC